jgi:hypothetical protein
MGAENEFAGADTYTPAIVVKWIKWFDPAMKTSVDGSRNAIHPTLCKRESEQRPIRNGNRLKIRRVQSENMTDTQARFGKFGFQVAIDNHVHFINVITIFLKLDDDAPGV